MRELLAKGADVNTVSVAETDHVKNGAIALGNFAALAYCVSYGGREAEFNWDHTSERRVCFTALSHTGERIHSTCTEKALTEGLRHLLINTT
jgi:hypothetical protein